ncbi:hypothetical protein [Actinoalloteichus caeruleus]|uniref:hypothetical protein n=1 Tax=Actinoalloteichus cyanogriseus TaxID=2893586 RepID=UPI003AAF2FF2
MDRTAGMLVPVLIVSAVAVLVEGDLMYIEDGGGGTQPAAMPEAGKMMGSIGRFSAAAAAGKVSIDPESAESMARKIDAIAVRAKDRRNRVRTLDQNVPLGSSPVALQMSAQTRLSAAGTPQSAEENLELYIEALTELAAAIRASARRTQAADEQTAAEFNRLGEDGA